MAYGPGFRSGRVALVVAGLMTVPGCATLPGVEREMAVPNTGQVQLEGAHGPVSAARSEDILTSYKDSWPNFHLGRSSYTELLRAGVNVYERHGAVMHARTGVIGDTWSTIGSSDLDWRIFLYNDEINAVIPGREFAAQMEAKFAADLAESEMIVLDQWRHRSWLLRLHERPSRPGAHWL